jgi:hypothetical protein
MQFNGHLRTKLPRRRKANEPRPLRSIRIGAEFFGASLTIEMNHAAKLSELSLMTAWLFAQRIA